MARHRDPGPSTRCGHSTAPGSSTHWPDLDHRVTYQHGVDHVVDAVTSGAAVAAVLIRPVSVAEIERTAREGALMPPKSTFFTPKLRTGLVIRSLV